MEGGSRLWGRGDVRGQGKKKKTYLFLSGSQSCFETELCRNTFNSVGGVDVFDAGDLKASSGALAGDNG